MKTDFENHNVLITGAGGELGSVLCRAFMRQGARVAALVHRRSAPEGVVVSVPVDLTDPESVGPAVRAVEEKMGSIDVLINNAAAATNALLPGLGEAELQRLLGVNLGGVLLVCRAAIPGMISRRRGCLLNISSLAASSPLPGQAVYATCKGGVESLTRALAVELAPRRIRVNAIAPGFLDSAMVRDMDAGQRERILGRIPAGRWGTKEEIAEAAVFLCSDKASYMTGQIFHVDGGLGM